jgi:hypothetical protein
MQYVMKVVGFASGESCEVANMYLLSFDFNADDGQGMGVFTDDLGVAKKFDAPSEAMAFWNTISTVKPFREDGKPNKPMTSSTVEILPVVEA